MSEIKSRRDVLCAGSAAIAGTVLSAAGASPAAATQGLIALTGVTVVDATGRPPQRNTTVLVRGERIAAVGQQLGLPAAAQVVDLPGRFVIPGLCDAHVHSFPVPEISPPLYLANGVTTVREMSGTELLHAWRAQVERGELLGPRSVIASRIVDGAPTIGDPATFVEVASAQQAREAVRLAKRTGADFVKIYSRLPADLYRVIADEARRQAIPFAGHLPDAVPMATAGASGQRSIEHLFATWYGTSTREPELRVRITELTISRGDYPTWLRETHRLEWDAVTSYSPQKAAAVFATLTRNRTRAVPTLSVHRVLDRPDEVALTDDRLRYAPASTVDGWRWALENVIAAGWTAEETAQRHVLFDRRLAFVGDLAAAGVPVIAGTDGGDVPFLVPGFSLHDELALLVRAGLSPLAALRAATLDAARLLGLDAAIGTVEPGKLADLVVLDADPLADIRNTTRIHTVLTRGHVLTPERRTRMLADIATAAARA